MYNDDTELDTVSALDLTCKFDDEKLTSEINQRVVSSPVLMPPPSSIPVKTMPITSGPKIFPMTQSSKQIFGENVPVSKMVHWNLRNVQFLLKMFVASSLITLSLSHL